ncbi:MAG: DM13 domain-containing protein [Rhizobiaceae bacterium]|nr:DM13 domain-containing protein [Rhizobiaceae bacterium]
MMDLRDLEQSGSDWHPKAHDATGAWRIVADDCRLWLKLGADFRTDWGPDVKLYLVAQAVGDIGVRDQLGDSGTLIGPIQAFEGAQEYALPAIDRFAGFRAIMLHCQRYSAVWCGIEINLQSP